ncbi:ribokinase [Siccirubricoccus sp. KC 17139]|uniref:Ribokinase n=1 Tax=Siccirubricoccus soli TaxID=2899147 RepID=A0ABT1D4Q9_9PROT|nr:ribokinase [Siccirubricoccus soli]MCO6416854.1 ribokinase [Siccirubricoccus soli]MCP2682989.1 ribokinase [Siccirubricoccus soli]
MPVLVFGSINLDLVFALPSLPVPGETVLAPGYRPLPGGKGANQALAAALDGAAVGFAGAVGEDAFAELALAGLRSARVDLSRLARVAAPTACAAVQVDPAGRNQIAVGSGANRLLRAAQVEDAALSPATTLLLQMEVPAAENEALLRRARAAGVRLLLNLAPAAPLAREALAALDLLIVNEPEAAWLAAQLGCGAGALALQRALGIDVAVTLGEAGSEAATAAGLLRQPAFAVAAVDTTGAGDAWCGVLAAALDHGLPLEQAMRRASAAAALCCTRPGAAMPRAAETEALLRGG